jgi:hypothetical protein
MSKTKVAGKEGSNTPPVAGFPFGAAKAFGASLTLDDTSFQLELSR